MRHLLLEFLASQGDLFHQGLVAEVAQHPAGDQQGRHHAQQAEAGQQPSFAARLDLLAAPGEVGFREHHVAQQTGDEVTFARSGRRLQDLTFQVEGAGEGGQHAVEWAAFLGAAAEVEAAQQGLFFERRTPEYLLQKVGDHGAQVAKLLWEGIKQGTPLRVAFLIQAGIQPAAEAGFKGAELGLEGAQRRQGA